MWAPDPAHSWPRALGHCPPSQLWQASPLPWVEGAEQAMGQVHLPGPGPHLGICTCWLRARAPGGGCLLQGCHGGV